MPSSGPRRSAVPDGSGAEANPPVITQRLEEDRTALFMLKNLQENLAYPWCQKMFARVTPPPSIITRSFACGNGGSTT